MPDELELRKTYDLAADNKVLSGYLESLGLPTDNVIASPKDRERFQFLFPQLMQELETEHRQGARYLSKFAISSTIGLFDAALNYVWNEVVVNLRKKVVIYGLDLFYNEAVGGKNRENYSTEEDLSGIKDIVLLDTCKKLETISEDVYDDLDYILTKRNKIAASHPNDESITGLQLVNFLEVCLTKVIKDERTRSAIRIGALIKNIKSLNGPIDETDFNKLSEELKNLSTAHINNLLETLFSIYIDEQSDQNRRSNIIKISTILWELATDPAKVEIASRVDSYRSNLESGKRTLGNQFIKLAGGSRYQPLSSKIIELNDLIDKLRSAHEGWDNFYHEPQYITSILGYFENSNDIPSEVAPKLIKTVMRCRIGRGLDYNEGVSPRGRPLYDQIFTLLDDQNIVLAIKSIFEPEIRSKLSFTMCQKHLKGILDILYSRAISDRLKEAIDFLRKDVSKAATADKQREFKMIFDPLLLA